MDGLTERTFSAFLPPPPPPHVWTNCSLKCATFPPLNAALFLWLNGDLPSFCICLPIQMFPAGICCKNVFQSTVWCPCKPLSKINSECTSLAQSAFFKLLPLSNGKGYIAKPFRRTSSHTSFVLCALKNRGIEILTEVLETYLDGSFTMDEHLILLNKDTGAVSPGHVSSEKTFSLNCNDKAPQKEKHLRWIGCFFFFWKHLYLFPILLKKMCFWQGAMTNLIPILM